MRISDWSSDVCSSDLPARGSAYQRQRSGVECVLVDGGVRDLAVVPLDQRQVGADLIRGELDRVEFRVQMHARLRRGWRVRGVVREIVLAGVGGDRKSTRLNSSN